MRSLNIILGIVIALIVLFSCFLSLAYSNTWFIYAFESQGVYSVVDRSVADNTMHGITLFLRGKTNQIPNLSPNEMSHMEDVRVRINFVYYLLIVFLVLFILLCIILWKRLEFSKIFVYSGIFLIVILVILGLPFLLRFEQSFIKFHELLFPNGNWAFDPNTYLLTRMLSEEIFSSFVKTLTGLWVFSSVLLVIVGKCLKASN